MWKAKYLKKQKNISNFLLTNALYHGIIAISNKTKQIFGGNKNGKQRSNGSKRSIIKQSRFTRNIL